MSEQKPNELGDDLIGCIAEVFGILRAAKMDAILSDFREKMNREDIVIRFYEDFLAAYKPEIRELRGVYYTPEPVVSYMVRSVDILIKEKFDMPLGLADPEVMILDPACGTGTFLLWIFKLIYDRFENDGEARSLIKQKLGDISWSDYVRDHLLPRVFGFELLMAPYAICHLKLGLFLEESGYRLDSSQRLGVYLTNSLESTRLKTEELFQEFIAEEADKAAEIKRDKPISLVIGNPPYSALSGNLSDVARSLVDSYRYVDRQLIQEKSALQFEKNIQADYVKFFALSQLLISKVQKGIISLITNNSFLDSVTLRGMRSSLLDTFTNIYVFDLHGDVDKGELTEDGDPDRNVFDIKQGVGIFTGVREQNEFINDKAFVNYFELLGDRAYKYSYLNNFDTSQTHWTNIIPIASKYLFKSLDKRIAEEYESFTSITEIFGDVNSSGFESGKDSVLTAYTEDELNNKLTEFCQGNPSEVINKFKIKEGWGLSIFERRNSIANDPLYNNRFYQFLFTPFDWRYTFYRKDLLKTNSFSAGQHLVYGSNYSLVVMRQVSMHEGFSHALVASSMPNNRAFYSKKGKTSYFPLYLYSGGENSFLNSGELLGINFHQEFISKILNKLGFSSLQIGLSDLNETVGAENILNYIYAILHSQVYRERYVDFLKTDFPRIPFTSNRNTFKVLSLLGQELIALHLMKSPQLEQYITRFIENGGNLVVDATYVKYADGEVIINKKGDRFTGVPESVWNFYVGGYQVCHKWLKDRKGRQLSPDDLNHYQKIVVALSETMQIMNAIDAAIPSFPIE